MTSPDQHPAGSKITNPTPLAWVGSVRRELLDRILIVNEHHLRRVLVEYET